MFSSTILHKTIQFGLCKFYKNIQEKIISVLISLLILTFPVEFQYQVLKVVGTLLVGYFWESCFVDPKWIKKNRLIIEKHWNVIRKVYEPVFFHHIQFPDKESDHIIHFSIITVLCLNIKLINHRIMTFCGFPASSWMRTTLQLTFVNMKRKYNRIKTLVMWLIFFPMNTLST